MLGESSLALAREGPPGVAGPTRLRHQAEVLKRSEVVEHRVLRDGLADDLSNPSRRHRTMLSQRGKDSLLKDR